MVDHMRDAKSRSRDRQTHHVGHVRRAAVVLRGAHTHMRSLYRIWGPDDWRVCWKSLKDTYIRPRQNQSWRVDVYYHTHSSNESKFLRAMLRPRNYSEAPVATTIYTQITTTLAALETVHSPHLYDELLLTRFDVLYKLDVGRWNLRHDHFNIPFQHPDGVWCDVFFVFNASFFAPLVRLLRSHNAWSLHRVNLTASALSPHRLMVRKRYFSDTSFSDIMPANRNPLYELLRKRRWGHTEKIVHEMQSEAQDAYWWWWRRLVRMLKSNGGSVLGVFGLALLLCACVQIIWMAHMRSRGARAACSPAVMPAVLISCCVWFAVPLYVFCQLYGDAFMCSKLVVKRHCW